MKSEHHVFVVSTTMLPSWVYLAGGRVAQIVVVPARHGTASFVLWFPRTFNQTKGVKRFSRNIEQVAVSVW